MFFTPPQVKSLSRYSEFGTHLHDKHFLIMLAAAAAIHAFVIAIMLLSPHEEVLQVPVRVLNVKLGDMDTTVDPADMPQIPVPTAIPAPEPAEMSPPAQQHTPQKAVRAKEAAPATPQPSEGELSKMEQKPTNPSAEKVWLPAKSYSKPASYKPVQQEASEGTLSQPKHYVRENDLEQELAERAAKDGKTGGKAAGGGAGDEAIERYEQVISIWLAQHKIYPEAAKAAHIEGDAVVRIRINRKGKMLYYGLERSSGTALIDQAVMEMVKASDPVPAVPEDYPDGNQLEFLIPVTYRLQ